MQNVRGGKCLIELTGNLVENEQSRILVKFIRFLVKSVRILMDIINIRNFFG